VKVVFDPMTAILLHQFDGSFLSRRLIETQQNRQLFAKASMKKLLSLAQQAQWGQHGEGNTWPKP
jgi:hypothetical protein